MNQILNIEQLKKNLGNHKHDIGNVSDILPFTTSFRNENTIKNFNVVIGDFVRKICRVEFMPKKKNAEYDLFQNDPIITNIIDEIEFSPEHRVDLERLLRNFLYNDQANVKVFHPYIYNFLPESDKPIYKKYAQFIADVLVYGNEDIRPIFTNKESEDLLSDLILTNLELKEAKSTNVRLYQPAFETITKLYQEDVLFISKHKDFFLKYFSLLTHFYTFIYVCQLFVKFEEMFKADYTRMKPLYFALEWEPLNKRRKAADEIEGYKFIKNNYHKLFVHIHTLSQLSLNSLCNPYEGSPKEKLKFYNYQELDDIFSSSPPDLLNQFITDINNWIAIYSDLFSKRVVTKGEGHDLKNAIQLLFKCISEGVNEDAAKNYGKNIENLAGNVFLKARGSIGTVLNINHDMLMLLTAISVKDKRIPLKVLFEEYEKRGVAFDRISRKAIIELLDSYNLIDKKSDSGDAQYVKPIL